MLDVPVKMEIIDFAQPRIKQKLPENIIITPDKCVIGIDYVHPCSPFARMILRVCFGLGPFTLDTADRDHDQRGSFRNLTFLEEGGRGLGETSQGRFSRQNR